MATDRFHEVFARLGGRFDHRGQRPEEELVHRAQAWLTQLRGDPKTRPSLPPITFGYIDNTAVNAVACEEPDGAFVGIFDGVVLVLFDLFTRMLSHRDTYPEIGNASQESDAVTMQFLTHDAEDLMAQLDVREPMVPRDEVRWNYAMQLLATAHDFFLLHEVAHVLNGHVRLLRERGYLPAVDERSATQYVGGELDIRQTLEMDADAFALIKMCGNWMSTPEESRLLAGSTSPHALGDWMFMMFSAVYMAMRVYHFGENASSKSHPSPASRRNMAGATILTNVRGWLGADAVDEIGPYIGLAALRCEQAIEAIVRIPMPRDDIRDSFDLRNTEWEKLVVAKWRDIYPDLRRLAHTDRLIPPPDGLK